MCWFHYVSDISGYTEVLYHPKSDLQKHGTASFLAYRQLSLDCMFLSSGRLAQSMASLAFRPIGSYILDWILKQQKTCKKHGIFSF